MSERSFVLKRDEGNQKSSKRSLAIIPSPERNTERARGRMRDEHRERNKKREEVFFYEQEEFFTRERSFLFVREQEEFFFTQESLRNKSPR